MAVYVPDLTLADVSSGFPNDIGFSTTRSVPLNNALDYRPGLLDYWATDYRTDGPNGLGLGLGFGLWLVVR